MRLPYRSLTALLALAACGSLPSPRAPAAQEPGDGELLRLHRTMVESMILRHDVRPFEEVALDQLLLIPPGGILETRDEAVAGVGAFAVERLTIDEEVVTRQGSTAVVIARLTLDGQVMPVGRLPPMRTMSVFVQTGGEWRLLARSLTPCLPVAVQRGRC